MLPTSAAGESTPTATSHRNSLSRPLSPQLIVGLLAFAFFAIGIVALFGCRRMMRRGWAEALRSRNEEEGIPISTLEEPKLWELWNGGELHRAQEGCSEHVKQVISPDPGYRDNDGRWANIMPLYAKAVSVADGATDPPPASGRNHLQAAPIPPLEVEPNLSNHLLPAKWRRMSKDIKGIPPQPPTSTKLQVGVVIITPSPRFPLYVKEKTSGSGADHKPEKSQTRKRTVITDFSIGMYECAWDEFES